MHFAMLVVQRYAHYHANITINCHREPLATLQSLGIDLCIESLVQTDRMNSAIIQDIQKASN